jgi:hypothetical protein
MRRGALLLLSAAIFAAVILRHHPGYAQDASAGPAALTPVERPIEDELVLELRLGRYVLSDGMLGFLHRGGVLLPLDELARALDFAIAVDPAAGRATGWFLAENRRFALDMARGEVTLEGQPGLYDRTLVELHADDIYVDTTLLAKWFPVDIEFELSRLVIELTSREPLPLEQRLERERRQAMLGRGAFGRPQYPRLETPYRLWDWPFVDTTHRFDFTDGDGLRASSTTLIMGDLLFMDTSLFLAGNDQELVSDARFTMGRKDPEGGLLGPVGLSELEFGDVFTPQLPLVAGQREGRGATISTFPLNRPTEFDRTTLRGELPLGWEVELYRNEILLDFQRSRADGRYEFIDVPLLFGLNVLRLQFYGPQGQRREEIQRLFIGPGLVQPGEQFYRVAVNQQDQDTIPVGEVSDDPDKGKARFFGEYERGITRNLAVAGSLASFFLDDRRHSYPSLGLRTALFGSFLRLDATKDTASGTAVQGSIQTRLFGLNLFAEHGQFFDFISERVRASTDSVDSLSNVRLDGVIPEWVLPRIPFSLNGTLERRESGRSDLNVANRLSIFLGGVSASNTVTWRRIGGGGIPTATSASGTVLLNGRIDRLLLRGALNYTLDPVSELSNISATADYTFDRDFTARATVNRQLTGQQITTFSAGISRIFANIALGANASYSDDGNFAAGLTLTFGVGREPRTGSFVRRPRGIARSGAASARVFLDNDQDGRYGEGDLPLEGVRFHQQRDVETDENGVAFITGLSSYRPTAITLNPGTLEDPYWTPEQEGAEIVPRPGKTALVDFPVVPTGEIDGTVFLRRDEVVREVSNVALQLVDEQGKLVDEVRSAFDGFYLFEFVRPGRYTLRVAPEQASRLNLIVPPPQGVVIEAVEGEADVVSGVDIVVERRAVPKDGGQ